MSAVPTLDRIVVYKYGTSDLIERWEYQQSFRDFLSSFEATSLFVKKNLRNTFLQLKVFDPRSYKNRLIVKKAIFWETAKIRFGGFALSSQFSPALELQPRRRGTKLTLPALFYFPAGISIILCSRNIL